MIILTIERNPGKVPRPMGVGGNPVLDASEVNGSIISKLLTGVVLFASKDKREIGFKANEVKKDRRETVCIYTGEIPKNIKI